MKNRIIKFRAWDTERNKFLPHSTDVHLEINNPRVYKLNPLTGGYYETDLIILQQFTGLLDKNGKEIYEGDIVKTGFLGNAEIIFNKAAFRARHKEFRDVTVWPIINGMKLEVIGNIYENSDLLK